MRRVRHGWDDAHNHLSQCRVRHHYTCAQTREKVTVWGVFCSQSWFSEINFVFLFFDPPSRVSPYLFVHFQHVWVSKRNVLWIRVRIRVSSSSLNVWPSSCFSWLRVSRSNLVRSRDSSLHLRTSFPVLDNWVLCFSSIRWMSLLLLAKSESQSHDQLNLLESVRGGRHDTYAVWNMTSPDFITIASGKQQAVSVSHRMTACDLVWKNFSPFRWESCMSTQYTVSWCTLSIFSIKMQDVVWSDQALLDLGDSCAWDSQAERMLSVCCSNFDLSVSILNWWWNVNWLHIQYDKCTRRNWSELVDCPVMKDHWDCVLNLLEELGGSSSSRPRRGMQEIFLEIFLNSPELNGSIFFSMHMLWMKKKDTLLPSIPQNQSKNISQVRYRSKFSSQ